MTLRVRLLPVFLALAGVVEAAKVYVFYPSMARPNVVQTSLSSKAGGHEITVFGRLADFTAMMTATPPDVILVPKALADQYKGFKVFLKGSRSGSATGDAVLLSTGAAVDPKAAGTMNLGIVGVLERPAMAGYASGIVGGAPKLKIVTKVEDLLPLLQFKSADAVLVGEDQVDDIKGKSAAQIVATVVPGAKWNFIVAAASNDDAGKAVEPVLKAFGAAEKKLLGVDGWTK